MNVLVINPPNAPFTSKGILIEPIDVLGVASCIAVLGHGVQLLDMDVHRISPQELLSHAKPHDIAVIIYDYHIPLHDDGTLAAVQDIARQLKSGGAKVIIGGKTATYKPERLLFPGSPVDVLVSHEMEPALETLLAMKDWSPDSLQTVSGIAYLDDGGRLRRTPRTTAPFDLDRLPMPDRRLVDLSAYIDVRPILSSRGCHMACDFCHVPEFWGKWRYRSPALVVDEIEHLVAVHGARKILFLDDNATVGRRHMQEICEKLIERRIEVAMGCLGSLGLFDEGMMDLMFRAGFRWIHYGVESGDDRLLASIHKGVGADAVRRIVGRTRARGFRVRTSWILDLPGTTGDELQRTADLILELQTEEIRLHHLAIRMGSGFYGQYGDIPSTQYIHKGTQNQNLSAISPDGIRQAAETLAAKLETGGYAIVRHPDEFIDLSALQQRAPSLKIASLCPMRYGLGWEY